MCYDCKPEISGRVYFIFFMCCWIFFIFLPLSIPVLSRILATDLHEEVKITQKLLNYSMGIDGVLFFLFILVSCRFYYQMWRAIQCDEQSLAPSKAVGLLFIPIFNIYWIISSFVGFAEDYNEYIERHSINAKKLSPILCLICSLLFLCLLAFPTALLIVTIFFPRSQPTPRAVLFLFGLMFWTLIPTAIIHMMMVKKICSRINNMFCKQE